MYREIFIAEIANVDSAGAVMGELVGAGTTYAERGVRTWRGSIRREPGQPTFRLEVACL